MGTNEKLVSGEFLMARKASHKMHGIIFMQKTNHQANNNCLIKNTNEEITHV